jgi:hypothetical protein
LAVNFCKGVIINFNWIWLNWIKCAIEDETRHMYLYKCVVYEIIISPRLCSMKIDALHWIILLKKSRTKINYDKLFLYIGKARCVRPSQRCIIICTHTTKKIHMWGRTKFAWKRSAFICLEQVYFAIFFSFYFELCKLRVLRIAWCIIKYLLIKKYYIMK